MYLAHRGLMSNIKGYPGDVIKEPAKSQRDRDMERAVRAARFSEQLQNERGFGHGRVLCKGSSGHPGQLHIIVSLLFWSRSLALDSKHNTYNHKLKHFDTMIGYTQVVVCSSNIAQLAFLRQCCGAHTVCA